MPLLQYCSWRKGSRPWASTTAEAKRDVDEGQRDELMVEPGGPGEGLYATRPH